MNNDIFFTKQISKELLKKIILLDNNDEHDSEAVQNELADMPDLSANKIGVVAYPEFIGFNSGQTSLTVEINLWDSDAEKFNENKILDISYFVETVINDNFSYYGKKIINKHSFPIIEFEFHYDLKMTDVQYFVEYLKNSFDKALEAV